MVILVYVLFIFKIVLVVDSKWVFFEFMGKIWIFNKFIKFGDYFFKLEFFGFQRIMIGLDEIGGYFQGELC